MGKLDMVIEWSDCRQTSVLPRYLVSLSLLERCLTSLALFSFRIKSKQGGDFFLCNIISEFKLDNVRDDT